MFDAEEDLHQELRVDQIVKKLRTLEGIIRNDMKDINWPKAYDRYSLFSVKNESDSDHGPKSANERRANFTGRQAVSTRVVNAETAL